MITAKDIFNTRLHGHPIKLEFLTKAHRAHWDTIIDLFYEHKIFKKVEDGAIVLYEVHITVPDLSNPSGRRILELYVDQHLPNNSVGKYNP